MKQSLPPLGWLRAFEAAARHLSFTGAARELNMTQSAVSQQIKSLEGYLGRPLFHRRPRALELTESGTTYLPVVRDAFRTLERGTRAITGDDSNVVQVRCNITFAIHWLAPRLKLFRQAHPDVLINLMTEIWEPRELATGADVEVRFSLRPADTVRAEHLITNEYYPVCAPNYEVSLEDVQSHPLFDCSNLLCNWPSWIEDQGLTWQKPHVTYATTYSVTLAVAAAGGGLAIAHDAIAGRLIRQGQLRVPFDHRAQMQEAYYLIMSPQAEQMPGAQIFADWLRRMTRDAN
ncbi:MAG: LysR substrate-binding domain-containing protein [Paracoccaceae bacterium]